MRTLLLAIFSITLSPFVLAQVNTVRTKNFFETIDQIGNAPTHCEAKRRVKSIFSNIKDYHDIEVSIKPKGLASYEGIDVSVLTKEDAQRLFEVFKKLDYIPSKYLEDGCYARAHELVLISKNNEIQLGKAFLVPKEGRPLLFPRNKKGEKNSGLSRRFSGWKYHANAFVLVINEQRNIKPYVFDIGVSDKIQSFEDWKMNLTNKSEDAQIIIKSPEIIFHDRSFSAPNSSIIDDLSETQKLIDKVGMDEYLFRLQNSGF